MDPEKAVLTSSLARSAARWYAWLSGYRPPAQAKVAAEAAVGETVVQNTISK